MLLKLEKITVTTIMVIAAIVVLIIVLMVINSFLRAHCLRALRLLVTKSSPASITSYLPENRRDDR